MSGLGGSNPLAYTRAYIDLGRLRANYGIIAGLSKAERLICVLKADAYGCGAVACAKALYECGARYFAAAHIDEAVELRKTLGKGCMIIILGSTQPEYADWLAEYDITQTIYSLGYAKDLAKHLGPRRIKAHIKADTGMNRIGFSCDGKGADEAAAAARLGCFDIQGTFSHLACADDPSSDLTDRQISRFEGFVSALKDRGVDPGARHICASSGIIRCPQAHFDMTRPGVILYGMQPSDTMEDIRKLGLMPVMRLESRIVALHTVKAGETVSYGGTWRADKDTLVATLPIGYGDGFVRAYSGMTVEIGGEKCPIIGRVCMDQCMVDVTGLDVELFDAVGVFTDSNPVEDFARHAGTITYECTCLLNSRIPRIYTDR
ncbi:MAG: alanine racemase [Clostridiales bacterium]|nr:alanine racemase [Clostridiales bacterium]